MTAPNAIVIGAAKAGTTALYWYLAEHPECFMSPMKETNFFAYGRDADGELLYGDPELHRFRIQTWSDYEVLFAGANGARVVGEVSPIYLECPQAAERIKDTIPSARIIVGLREPVDRAYSDFQMYLRQRGRRLDPERDLSPTAGWARPDSHWMKIGRYGELLRPFYDAFPREQIHVYLFDDLKRDPLGVSREIYRFLGIDPGFGPDLETPHNVGGVPGNMGLERFLTSHRLRKLAEPFVPHGLADRIRKLRTRNLHAAPTLPAELRRELVEPFRDDIRAAAALIERDLDHWLEPAGAGRPAPPDARRLSA